MMPGLLKIDLSRFEKSHHSGSTHTEKICSLLGGHQHSLRNYRDALTRGERVRNLVQNPEDLHWNRALITLRVDESSGSFAASHLSLFKLTNHLCEVKKRIVGRGIWKVSLGLPRVARHFGRHAHDRSVSRQTKKTNSERCR